MPEFDPLNPKALRALANDADPVAEVVLILSAAEIDHLRAENERLEVKITAAREFIVIRDYVSAARHLAEAIEGGRDTPENRRVHGPSPYCEETDE